MPVGTSNRLRIRVLVRGIELVKKLPSLVGRSKRRNYVAPLFVEAALEREFRAFWQAQGRSKSTIDKMDWTANHQIDFLVAVGNLPQALGRKMHRLRRKRNAIVHDLREATHADAEECVDVAANTNPLPGPTEPLRPHHVLL